MARSRGSMLVLVLLVLGVLALVAISFSYRVSLEQRLVRGRAVHARLREHAASCVAIAMARLRDNRNEFDHRAEPWHAHEPLAGWDAADDGGPAEYLVDYSVIDEEGKLHVQHASSEDLATLGMSEEQASSLLDWMDADDEPAGPLGAEHAHYALRPVPYRCKNAPLQTLGELLLVRGIGRADYLGEDRNHSRRLDPPDDADGLLRLGWVDLLTCHGDGRININTAPAPVLATLPLSDGAVDQILAYRRFDELSLDELEQHAFAEPEDIEQLQGLSEADRAVLGSVARFRSTFFRIFAWSIHRPTGMRYDVEVLVRMEENTVRVVQWRVGS